MTYLYAIVESKDEPQLACAYVPSELAAVCGDKPIVVIKVGRDQSRSVTPSSTFSMKHVCDRVITNT